MIVDILETKLTSHSDEDCWYTIQTGLQGGAHSLSESHDQIVPSHNACDPKRIHVNYN